MRRRLGWRLATRCCRCARQISGWWGCILRKCNVLGADADPPELSPVLAIRCRRSSAWRMRRLR